MTQVVLNKTNGRAIGIYVTRKDSDVVYTAPHGQGVTVAADTVEIVDGYRSGGPRVHTGWTEAEILNIIADYERADLNKEDRELLAATADDLRDELELRKLELWHPHR